MICLIVYFGTNPCSKSRRDHHEPMQISKAGHKPYSLEVATLYIRNSGSNLDKRCNGILLLHICVQAVCGVRPAALEPVPSPLP